VRRRFRRGRPKQPLQLTWVSSVFNTSTSLTPGSFSAGQVFLDGTDWEAPPTANLVRPCYVRRVIANFGYTVNIRVDENSAIEGTAFFWALVVEDDDEADTTILNGAAGEIIQQNRMLATGLQCVAGNGNDTDNPSSIHYCPTQHIDWKGRLRLQPNQRLTLFHQTVSDFGDAAQSVFTPCFARILIETP